MFVIICSSHFMRPLNGLNSSEDECYNDGCSILWFLKIFSLVQRNDHLL